MENSILKSTKKILGIGPTDDSFDLDVLTFINTALSDLDQIGLMPEGGLVVESEEIEWLALNLPYKEMNMVRTYVYLKVRLLFDPPATSFAIDAMKQQLDQCFGRLSIFRESRAYQKPTVEERL